jgi:hypothetical protein
MTTCWNARVASAVLTPNSNARQSQMSSFAKLQEFEKRFPKMDTAELKRWAEYWNQHAQGLRPKIRKQAMKRVYEIEKVIRQKSGESETE